VRNSGRWRGVTLDMALAHSGKRSARRLLAPENAELPRWLEPQLTRTQFGRWLRVEYLAGS